MHSGKTTCDILIVFDMLGFIHSFMTGNVNPKLSRGFETIVCVNGSGDMTKMAAMSMYDLNLKNLLLWNRWTDLNETWYIASGRSYLS